MKFTKRVISNLTKCYAVSSLTYKNQKHFVVASEKDFPCLLFDAMGNLREEIWPGTPGGVMSLVPLEHEEGGFLATQRFYSPNDSKQARLVHAFPNPAGGWKVSVIASLPHVHRFDVLRRGDVSYLLACTICSGRDYADDWSYPGKVYGCVLPEDLTAVDEAHPLALEVLRDGLLKNHGYLRYRCGDAPAGLVTCESGVYRFVPPAEPGGSWEITHLLAEAVSDVCMVDFDGDGMDEMVTIGPFHGDTLKIHKLSGGVYKTIYTHPEPLEFAHAIWGGVLCGKPAAIVGHRRGRRELICLTGDEAAGFGCQVIDRDVGAANVFHDIVDGREIILSTNREVNEVAVYTADPGASLPADDCLGGA